MIEPRYQSATMRKQLRRNIRNVLGTSSDQAPNAAQVARAADALIDLMDLATAGRIQLKMFDRAGNPLDLTGALATARGERS